MDVAAEPVAGAVHVELAVGGRFDHRVDVADGVAVEQAGVEHALREHAHRRVVRVALARAGAGRGDGGALRRLDDVVELALRRAGSGRRPERCG